MQRTRQSLPLVAISAFALVVVGCAKEPTPAPPAANGTAADVASPSDVPEGFAELPEADRAAALAQKICPVSDEELGSMGSPLKVSVNGRNVYLCCEGCRDSLLAEPDKYLAKLDAKTP